MSIKLNGATNGSVEIDVPAAVGSDLSVTIPATAGELTVKGTDGSVDLGAIDIAASAPADSVNIDSSGRLLVGTSSASAISKFIVQGYVGGSDGFMSVRRGAAGADNQRIGCILFDDSSENIAARIDAYGDAAWGTNDYPGRLVFSTTADGASSPTERMRITSEGFSCINCTAPLVPSSVFNLRGNASHPAVATFQTLNAFGNYSFRNSSGTQVGFIQTTASSTTFSTSSDYRLKENVVPLTGASERLNQLQVHRFNFIADPDTTVDGFLAHEAQAVVPECVTGTKDEVDDEGNPVYQGIDQSKLVPLLTAALQEAIAEIESLKARLTALEGGAS